MASDDAISIEENRWTRVIRVFERVIVVFLMVLLMIVTALATLELGWLLIKDLSTTRETLLDNEEMLQLFGAFLLVLIGVEMLTALKAYVRAGTIHVEVVLEVALTAIAQKLIVLDSSRVGGPFMVGLASVIFALAAAYWAVRSARKRNVVAATA
jgi:uncharacterized membrane protein (DUF373 family)